MSNLFFPDCLSVIAVAGVNTFELAVSTPKAIGCKETAGNPTNPCPAWEKNVKITAEEKYTYSDVDDNHYDAENVAHSCGGSC